MRDNLQLKGIIFDIQKFCLHDGPGIRTTVFFKGCNLSCKWCHNPESISPKKQLSFDTNKCTLCGECVKVCPNKVHEILSSRHEVYFEKCTSCGLCIDVCVPDALKILGREVSIEEILYEVKKDRKFYEESGGGVTLSGGECTLQFDFTLQLLEELKKLEIHTCVETNAMLKEEKLAMLVPFTDIFLLDYKLTDKKLHADYTGKHNTQVLSNIELLDSLGAKVVLRCPIIPGVNDTEDHLKEIARISREYRCIEYAEVMPYHSIGRDKWKQIGKEYSFPDLETVSNDKAENWKDFIKSNGGSLG